MRILDANFPKVLLVQMAAQGTGERRGVAVDGVADLAVRPRIGGERISFNRQMLGSPERCRNEAADLQGWTLQA
jgi:hypothetical protein